MNPDQELRSLKRGLKALTLLNEVETIGITALARELDLPRTTAERILVTLASEGYVQRLPNDKRYRLSGKVSSLSRGFSDECRIVQIATPLIFSVTRRIGWPLAVATAHGDAMVLRVTSDSATSLWLERRRIGTQVPMLGSSSGLVAFATTPAAERSALLSTLRTSRYAINRERATSMMLLESFTGSVAERGYAFQPPPNDMPERSLSVPISVNGRTIAVLLLMYMPRALNNTQVVQDYLPMLKLLAEEISDRLDDEDALDEGLGEECELPAALQAASLRLHQASPNFAAA